MVKLIRKEIFLFLLLLISSTGSFSSSLCGDTTVRIMSWNLLNFPSQSNLITDTTTRLPCYRTVVQFVNPDILVTQENSGNNSVSIFLNSVMNANGNFYSAGTFINGYDTDNAIFYRSSCFRFLSNVPISTALRDISMFTLVHLSSGDTIRIFSCHLKASPGTGNEALRNAEVDSLRKVTNAFFPGTDFMICGDFNFYGSYEPAYQRLLQNDSLSDGSFIDPLVMTGVWNDSVYSAYHTQSTRKRAFGGGASGGLDDRFDLMLFSSSIMEQGRITYQNGSLTPVGNDGLHYKDSINRPPNANVSQNVAEALFCSADHLPVYAEFIFAPVIGVGEILFRHHRLRLFPNPSGSGVTLHCDLKPEGRTEIAIYDQFSRVVKHIKEERFAENFFERKIIDAGELPSGIYFVRLTDEKGINATGIFTIQ